MKTVLSFFMGTLCVALALAEPISAPQLIAIKAAHLFDGMSGTLISNGVIIVEGQTIKRVGSGLEIPKGARVIDLGDATLLPGFIDAHVHLSYDYNEDWYKNFYNELMLPVAERALHAAANGQKTLEAGFTTVRDLASTDFIAASLRNAIHDGLVLGPRMLVSNYAIGATAGHADAPPYPPQTIAPATPIQGVCNGSDQCRAAVRYQIKWGADVIKFIPSGGVLSMGDSVEAVQLTQDEMNAIVSEAHALGRKVAAHCHGDRAARMAIVAGTDSIEHGTFLTAVTLAEMKKKGVYLVPTALAMSWVGGSYPPAIQKKLEQTAAAHQSMLKKAIKIGVRIAFGSDAVVAPHGSNAKEFALLTQAGMSASDALMTAMIGAAKLLGVERETGSLSAGKAADIVAVKGNPLADIHATEHPVFVMEGGAVIRGL